jgi:hypothetical protein
MPARPGGHPAVPAPEAAVLTPAAGLPLAVIEEWNAALASSEPIGRCRRPVPGRVQCDGPMYPEASELVGGVLWLTSRCGLCRHEVAAPQGKRTDPPRDLAVRRARLEADWAERAAGDRR